MKFSSLGYEKDVEKKKPHKPCSHVHGLQSMLSSTRIPNHLMHVGLAKESPTLAFTPD
jgi:hypothetical protein